MPRKPRLSVSMCRHRGCHLLLVRRMRQRLAAAAPNWCVAVRDLRGHMRGARPYLLMLTYALLACACAVATLRLSELSHATPGPASITSSRAPSQAEASAEIGRRCFLVLSIAQLALISLIVPALSAGAIAIEREKQTLEMVRATLLTGSDILLGKLAVMMAFIGLLLMSTLPVTSWSLLLGGVSPAEIALVYSYLLAFAAGVAALGLAFSVLVKRAVGAISWAYGVLFGALVLPVVGLWFLDTLSAWRGTIGPDTAALIVVLIPTAVALVLFVVLRGLLSRLTAWGKGVRGLALAGGIALVGLFVLAELIMDPVLDTFLAEHVATLLIVHPLVLILSLEEGSVAPDFGLTRAWLFSISLAWGTCLLLVSLSVRLFNRQAQV